ncbi:MAG: hypothetical protein H6936_15155 [Burkholderiales bacterium]|nr:hypothetical protein [Burkholderiales bacterium]
MAKQFLIASAIFIHRLRLIENEKIPREKVSDDLWREHQGLATSVIMQCAAALETEAHEICLYGYGAFGAANKDDIRRILFSFTGLIDKLSTMDRFVTILRLLEKPELNKGSNPFQSAEKVIQLRNELVHYKSYFGNEMKNDKSKGKNLFSFLEPLKHKPFYFFDYPNINFFPHRCLNADCGAWAFKSVVDFLEEFYKALGVLNCSNEFDDLRSRVKLH